MPANSISKTKVLLLGAGFIADIHAECFQRFVPEAEVVGVYARQASKAEAFARRHQIPRWYDNMEQAIEAAGAELVDVCLPNFLHYQAVLTAARAGKHVIVEKPLCMNLEEADAMIQACTKAGVLLMYAEELCFAPKYERVRQLVREGAVGQVFQLRQCEKHSGPHSDWFYDVEQSGGGVLMDMGCHGLAWLRWVLGKDCKPVQVQAHLQTGLRHKQRTRGEENSVLVVTFENGVLGIVENSWAKPGGMDDRVEVYGTEGVVYADLFIGNSALTYSEKGYGYALEKAGSTQGWTFTIFEEAFNQGYPQELRHFIQCVQHGSPPLVTGEDGKAVMEMLLAAYASAGLGRPVSLPFKPTVKKPVDLWLTPQDS